MKKYYLISILSFILFLIVSMLAYRMDLKQEAQVLAVGDYLIHPNIYRDALESDGDTYNFNPMYQNIKKDIQSADIAFINQESPIGGDHRPYHGFKRFNTPSDISDSLVQTGFNFINGSNNHALDQGDEGLKYHIQQWNKYKNKVLFTGTYDSQKSHDQVAVKKINGINIAMLSYTFGTNGIKPKHQYEINYFDDKQIKKDIQQAKEVADVIFVSAHWGNEESHQPNPIQRKYAKLFADEGVDVVLGTHPHVIQPVEWIKGKDHHRTLVAYSLGNFLNGQETGNESNDLLGRIEFKIMKTPKAVKIENVKWRSMVNYYELSDVYNKNSKENFKIYPLKDMDERLIRKHGRYYDPNSDMSQLRLKQITKEVINETFLDDDSF